MTSPQKPLLAAIYFGDWHVDPQMYMFAVTLIVAIIERLISFLNYVCINFQFNCETLVHHAHSIAFFGLLLLLLYLVEMSAVHGENWTVRANTKLLIIMLCCIPVHEFNHSCCCAHMFAGIPASYQCQTTFRRSRSTCPLNAFHLSFASLPTVI